MEGWQNYKLNELGKVGRGKSKHRPRNDTSLYGGKYPFIQTGDIKAANFRIIDYSQTYNEKGLAQSKLWKKGTLCITIAANIAETAILGIDACFPDSIIGFIAEEKQADVRFIKYHFDLLKVHLQSISQGTTQDNLSQEKLLKFVFTLPKNIEHQQRIASILSTYDELIEINNHRIQLLEETVRELYKEWFVRMRFPNYKQTKLLKGIPDGWEVRKLGELSEFINRGISPNYDDNGDYVVLNQRCIRNNKIDLEVARRQNKNVHFNKILKHGDVLINSTGEGTLGRTAQLNDCIENLTADSHLTIARPKEEYKEFYGIAISLLETYFELMALGSTGQTELGRKIISDVLLKVPPKHLLEKFSGIVSPINEQVIILLKQNVQLHQIKDRLLPRLISGKLTVK